ncbi:MULTISPECIES: nitroreductase family protein [Pelosinus]|uniref:Nitroreductase n=1 Tax=Pelosinus fermentans B4 TaxID=1149862 RepID=I9LH15_9FIRM|nr:MULTISPECIES: nitroreductase [Pelosinus]EIW19794.1 nitroreductase [Pelosinus fermentans B4]EIW21349.1 nitroreductase [Pelosinus fermentans A11]OAM94948.1 nitroreductase [Pelosinus fermentans DSM 17108]SDR20913.1 Nitroreductase [Pelosinus fermentans]
MSEIVKAILQRRSIRNFKQEQIKDSELAVILEAGQFAPSARNEQSWHFTVIQNKDLLGKINEVLRTIFFNSGNPDFAERAKAENFSPFYHAPTLIIVSGNEKAIAPQHNGSLALGNLFLAAHALDIGSVWIHSLRSLFDIEEGRSLNRELGIPEGYSIVASGAFGYNAGEKPTPAPRKEGTITIIK